MNKKFSTLMAGLVLASGVATAQHAPSVGGFPYRTQDVLAANPTGFAASVVSSSSLKNAPYYQLANGTDVLVQVRDAATGELTLKMVAATSAPIVASLWSIEVKNDQVSGKQYIFRNKETGLELVFDHTMALSKSTNVALTTEDATILDGCTTEWSWDHLNQFTNTEKVVYSAFAAGDSVMVMQKNTANEIVAVKYSAAVAGSNLASLTNALTLKPVVATGIVLKADDINSMIDAYKKDGAKFKFNKNGFSTWETIANNVLAENTYVAEEVLPSTLADKYYTKLVADITEFVADLTQFATDVNAHTAATITVGTTLTDITTALATVGTDHVKFDAAMAKMAAMEAAVLVDITGLSSGSGAGSIDAAVLQATEAELDAQLAALTTIKTNVDALVTGNTYDQFNIRLKVKDSTPATYYMVDTTRNEANTSTQTTMKLVNSEIKGINPFVLARYNFRLTYFASNDSLSIEPLNASSKSTAEWNAGTFWADCVAGQKLVAFGDKATNTGIQVSNTVTNNGSTEYATKNVSLTVTNLGDGSFVPTTAAAAAYEFKARISFDHAYSYFERTSLNAGAWYVKLATTKHFVSPTNRADGQYLVANMAGKIVYDEWASTQDFEHMPATQWVIEHLGCADAINPRVRITNREYDEVIAFEGQLYKAGKDTVYFVNHDWNEIDINSKSPETRFTCLDTLVFVPVKDVKAAQNGYLNLGADEVIDNSFMLKHFSDYSEAYLKAVINKKDTLLNVGADGSNFELEPSKNGESYNVNVPYGKVTTEVPQLYRTSYTLKVKDFDKINNDQRLVGINKDGNYCIIDTVFAKTNLAYVAYFYLKENDHKDADHGYALVNKNRGFNSTGNYLGSAFDGADKLFVENKTSMAKKGSLGERQTDVFFMVKDTMPYYKRIGVQDTVAFYDAVNGRRVLIEDCNSPYSKDKGAGFLGFRSLDEAPALAAAPSMYVDTAYVRNETRLPLYLLAVGAQHKATKACDHAFDLANPGHSAHFGSRPYIQGRYLVDLSNPAVDGKVPYIKAKDAVHENMYTRLAFVNAIHMGDSIYILKDAEATYEYADSIKEYAVAILPITAETYNGATVSFRFKNQDDDENFYIETAGRFAGYAANGGAWVKNQNNVAVLATDNKDYYEDHAGNMTSSVNEDIYNATLFTLKKSTENPTDNEVIGTSEISVVAGEASVEINGAAGKKVVISNVLGQVVANTVITSDNAKVSVPAGVVVVSVEGEAAVKAIVK